MDKSGWLTPTGRFIECPMFKHLDTIQDDDELCRLAKADGLREELAGIEDDCNSIIEDEGAGWHHYEIAQDQAEWRVVKNLYTSGALRVGFSKDAMYFEGTPEGIKILYHTARNLAEAMGLPATFEPRTQ